MLAELTPGEIRTTFTVLIGAALVFAGVVLAALHQWSRRDVGAAVRAYGGWCWMVPPFLAAAWVGRTAMLPLLGVVSTLAFKEFAKATGLYRDWQMTLVGYAGIAALVITAAVADPTTGAPGWFGLYWALPAFFVAAVLLVPILRDRTEQQLQVMALATIGFVTTGWMFGHLLLFATTPHGIGALLFIVVAVEANDVAAFVSGRWFGHRPLRPRISARKTIGGALGALAVSLIMPFALQFALPRFDTALLLLTGALVGIGGQLGDLAISVIKRDLGIKDMGALIPGHGGVLDRIDSLIFVAPLFFHLVHFAQPAQVPLP